MTLEEDLDLIITKHRLLSEEKYHKSYGRFVIVDILSTIEEIPREVLLNNSLSETLIEIIYWLVLRYTNLIDVYLKRHNVTSWKDLTNILEVCIDLKLLIASEKDDFTISNKLDIDLPFFAYIENILKNDKERRRNISNSDS